MTSTLKRFITPAALLAVVVFFLGSCQKELVNGGIPSYIQIDTIKLSTTTGQGTASHKITDAWLFVDDQSMGTFELPCTIPVLFDGVHKITVRGGIKMNGIGGTRVPYPFYNFYNVTTNLYKDSIIKVAPAVQYFQDTQFPYQEDFNSGGISLVKDPVESDTDILRVTTGSDLFEGPCAAFYMPPGNIDTALFYTNSPITLPGGSAIVYLELNYKNNYPFLMGLFVNNPTSVVQKQIFQFNESATWNKIYINLSTFISEETQAQSFSLFFGAIKTGADTAKDVSIFMDNIKIVHE